HAADEYLALGGHVPRVPRGRLSTCEPLRHAVRIREGGMSGRIRAVAVLAGCAAFLLPAVPAQASFHFMSIREVSLGTAINLHNDAYVELQSYAPGQNLLGGHTLKT